MNSLFDGSIIDDTAGQVSYFPADAWQTHTLSTHYNNTYHLTNVPSAYMTFRFNASFVVYCSNVATDHGDFFVSVDGQFIGRRSAYATSLLPARPLFALSVEPGPHVLNISNAAANTIMSLDYFITSSATGSTAAVSPSAPSTSAPPSGRHPSSASKPVAYAVLGLLCALVAAALLWVARRCARTRVRARPPGPASSCRPDPPPYSLTARHA